MSRRGSVRLWGLWTVVFLSLLVSLCWIVWWPLYDLFREPQGAIAAQQRSTSGGKESGLEIVGWVEKNRVLKGEPFKVWFRVSNLTETPVRDLRLTVYGPGFGPIKAAGHSDLSPLIHRIDPPDLPKKPAELLWELPKNASRTMWVEVFPVERSGDYMLTCTWTWTDLKGTARGDALELGPLRLRSSRLEVTAGLKDFLLALAPLIISVGLALAGLFFQQRQQKHVQERQSWTAMLPASHELNFNLYLPLLSALDSFRVKLEKAQAASAAASTPVAASTPAAPSAPAVPSTPAVASAPAAADWRLALFFLLLSLRILRKIDAKGGFYLSDRRGEEIVGLCWNYFADELQRHLQPYRDLSSALDEIELKDSLTTFEQRLTDPSLMSLAGRVSSLEGQLETWATGKESASLKLVFIFETILVFEINRIYDFWYGEPGKFPTQEYEKLLALLEQEGHFREKTEDIRAYIRRFDKRRWPHLDTRLPWLVQ